MSLINVVVLFAKVGTEDNSIKDWSTLFLFSLRNERIWVTCKSATHRLTCDTIHLWFTIFTLDPCPFISHFKQIKCTSILKFMLLLKRQKISKKSKKSVTWPVAFIGKYLPQFSLCFIAGKCHGSVKIGTSFNVRVDVYTIKNINASVEHLSIAVPFWIIQTSAYVRRMRDAATNIMNQACNSGTYKNVRYFLLIMHS